jgi:hypothetical protein
MSRWYVGWWWWWCCCCCCCRPSCRAARVRATHQPQSFDAYPDANEGGVRAGDPPLDRATQEWRLDNAMLRATDDDVPDVVSLLLCDPAKTHADDGGVQLLNTRDYKCEATAVEVRPMCSTATIGVVGHASVRVSNPRSLTLCCCVVIHAASHPEQQMYVFSWEDDVKEVRYSKVATTLSLKEHERADRGSDVILYHRHITTEEARDRKRQRLSLACDDDYNYSSSDDDDAPGAGAGGGGGPEGDSGSEHDGDEAKGDGPIPDGTVECRYCGRQFDNQRVCNVHIRKLQASMDDVLHTAGPTPTGVWVWVRV